MDVPDEVIERLQGIDKKKQADEVIRMAALSIIRLRLNTLQFTAGMISLR
jgi:hypothetical protein